MEKCYAKLRGGLTLGSGVAKRNVVSNSNCFTVVENKHLALVENKHLALVENKHLALVENKGYTGVCGHIFCGQKVCNPKN